MRSLTIAFACLFTSFYALAVDKLVILSPHRKSVQQEFVPAFEKYYKATFGKEIVVEWLDHGGASDDLRFLLARLQKNPNSAGIDLMWGGGEHPYLELDRKQYLIPYPLSDSMKMQIPARAAGVPLHSATDTWHATAMSSFGILYNKRLITRLKLTEPATWDDITSPSYFEQLSNADPRRSSVSVTMSFVILQASKEWDKGWETLTRLAANTRVFTQSSSAPIKDVVSGEVSAGLTVCYFALAKIGDLGTNNLGFVLPKDQTILNADPIGIIKGAPNVEQAKRLIDFVLSKDAQRLLVLPKGTQGGPKFASLGRMAVNEGAYADLDPARVISLNPFKLQFNTFMLDLDLVARMQFVLADLIGAIHIDTHSELKKAWKAVIARGLKPDEVRALAKMPVTQQEVLELSKRWDDQVFRNTTINSWVTFARNKYQTLVDQR